MRPILLLCLLAAFTLSLACTSEAAPVLKVVQTGNVAGADDQGLARAGRVSPRSQSRYQA